MYAAERAQIGGGIDHASSGGAERVMEDKRVASAGGVGSADGLTRRVKVVCEAISATEGTKVTARRDHAGGGRAIGMERRVAGDVGAADGLAQVVDAVAIAVGSAERAQVVGSAELSVGGRSEGMVSRKADPVGK